MELSLTVRQRERLAVISPKCEGKTSFLCALAGALPPQCLDSCCCLPLLSEKTGYVGQVAMQRAGAAKFAIAQATVLCLFSCLLLCRVKACRNLRLKRMVQMKQLKLDFLLR